MVFGQSLPDMNAQHRRESGLRILSAVPEHVRDSFSLQDIENTEQLCDVFDLSAKNEQRKEEID